ncbi:MAG TPA: DUF924 family protein [Kiloniellaceae bacterium]|nr:DUF924 family protein [Kiloniellaceae bacterium]
MSAIESVLAFWFRPAHREKWFVKDAAFDAAVATELSAAFQAARRGDLSAWRGSPEGCLALCILLDQVPRNLFRGSAEAFAADAQARAITRHAVAEGYDRGLTQEQRLFLYMPLEHSEALADQEDCCRLMAALDEDPGWHDFALKHRDIVARFGRFPHRNAALGRPSTPEEARFLTEPGSSF